MGRVEARTLVAALAVAPQAVTLCAWASVFSRDIRKREERFIQGHRDAGLPGSEGATHKAQGGGLGDTEAPGGKGRDS